jgi:hypothetical protein
MPNFKAFFLQKQKTQITIKGEQRMKLSNRVPVRILIITLMIFFTMMCFTSGCITPRTKNEKNNRNKVGIRQPASLYYDFGDVLIPKELKIDQKQSFIYRTGGYACGLMILTGHVELTSLINFFSNNMVKDNWRLLSTFKSPRTLLLFQKDNRWCIITITEGGFARSSEVSIWVAPTGSQASSGAMGQPDGFSEAIIN